MNYRRPRLRSNKKTQQRRLCLPYTRLEKRHMLAGDVTVFIDDSVLLVIGDGADNEIQVTESGGNFEVNGIDTTINGSSNSFTGAGINFVTIALEAGDDIATVTNVEVARNLSFYGREGNDRFVTTGSMARFFHGDGGAGDDIFEMDFTSRKSTYLYLGAGDDVVSASNLTARRNFKVYGGDGNDTISTQSLLVGRKLEFELANGNDNVVLGGETTVRRRAFFELGNGDDFLGFAPEQNSGSVSFESGLRVDMGQGADNLALDANVNLESLPQFDGGEGTDALARANQNDAKVSGFESFTVDNLQELIDAVNQRLADVDIAPTGPGGGETDPLQASFTTSTLTFTENSAAVPVDPSVILTGGTTIDSATIALSSFSRGNETLSFSDTNNISGSFAEATGQLTLSGTASVSEYQAALREVSFENTSDDPVTSTRQIDFSLVTDEETVTGSRNLEITSVNDLPTIELQSNSLSVNATELPFSIASQIQIADVDNTQLESAVVAITSGFVAGEDTLTFTQQSGVTGTFDPSTGALTFSRDFPLADLESVLRSVSYDNSSESPTAGTRDIRITINDGIDAAFADLSLDLEVDAVS